MLSGILGKIFNSDNDKIKQGSPRNIKHSANDIGSLLRVYQADNHLLMAIIQEENQKRPEKLSTGIIHVDEKQRVFVTDTFLPEAANARLQAGARVQFSLTQQGIRHQFEASWKKQIEDETGPKHLFDFPRGIEQVQLRDSFRVKISQAHPIKVALTHAEKPPITGTLADLSASGMRMRIIGLIKPKPVRGEQYTSCHFVLSDGSAIACIGRLMHWQYDSENDVSYLGIHFESVDGGTQRTLNRYLTDLQRKQRQVNP
ncbi:MAG TPA: flagellar regulator YcgR PilZN domain-containing protein [Dongiaceae bacterium]|nr:flagellar regulator YcgR PilZN domain-containing protein [Dongiaceae bacterium]